MRDIWWWIHPQVPSVFSRARAYTPTGSQSNAPACILCYGRWQRMPSGGHCSTYYGRGEYYIHSVDFPGAWYMVADQSADTQFIPPDRIIHSYRGSVKCAWAYSMLMRMPSESCCSMYYGRYKYYIHSVDFPGTWYMIADQSADTQYTPLRLSVCYSSIPAKCAWAYSMLQCILQGGLCSMYYDSYENYIPLVNYPQL